MHALRHCAVALLFALALLARTSSAGGLDTLRVTSQDFHQRVASGVAFFEDKAGDATLEQIRAAHARGEFAVYEHDSLQFGYSLSTYWMRFSVENQLASRTGNSPVDRFFVSVRYPLLDDVQMFAVRGDGNVESMVLGDAHNYFDRLFLLNDLIFPLALAPQEKVEIYLRVQSANSVSIPIYVNTERAFLHSQSTIESLNGTYFGITIGLFFYNVFLWIGVRKPIYGIYVLFLATYLLFNASMMGYTFRLWPDALQFQQVSIFVFSVLSGCSVIWFGIEFLQSKIHMPRIHKLLCANFLIAAVAAPLMLGMHPGRAAELNAVIVMAGIVVLFAAAILRVRQGYRPASYYLIGQGSVLAGIVFTVLTSRGILPYYYMASDVLKWSAAFEVLFFSIGLADLLNEERRLRETAQQKSDNTQRELLQVQIQLNEELDRKVHERTQALENANSKLQQLSTTDELTQLYNRRHINEMLAGEYRRALRDKTSLSLLMLDIDHFKQINDNYGHPTGDACLVHAAKIISGNIRRPPDVAARYGGEEFVVLLPNTQAEGARIVAENILHAFNTSHVQHAECTIPVSVSIGVASIFPTERDGHQNLLAEADRQLYLAKQGGRNQVAHSTVAV
jgi:diguanylate cyclase (GGDEF)-like protein